MRILKFKLNFTHKQLVEIPKDSRILSVNQYGIQPYLYIIAPDNIIMTKRLIVMYETDEDIKEEHVSEFQIHDGFKLVDSPMYIGIYLGTVDRFHFFDHGEVRVEH